MRILRRFYALSILMVIASIVVSGCSSAPVSPASSNKYSSKFLYLLIKIG